MTPTDGAKSARDNAGRFSAGNPGGGRPALPPEFREKGPEALRRIVELMASGDEGIALKAGTWIAERIFGKAPKAPEDTDDAALAWAELMSRMLKANEPQDP